MGGAALVALSATAEEVADSELLDIPVESVDLVVTSGDGAGDLDGLVDQELAKSGLARQVCVGLSGFLSPAHLVAKNDVLLTCLGSVAEIAQQANPELLIRACPVPLPQVQISQVWHSRTQDDPLRRWLRQHIHQLLVRS